MLPLSRVGLFVTPWTAADQASLSIGFSRQEYWSGLPFPSPGDLPDPGIEPRSPTLQADTLPSKPPGKPKGVKGKTAFHGMDLIHVKLCSVIKKRQTMVDTQVDGKITSGYLLHVFSALG